MVSVTFTTHNFNPASSATWRTPWRRMNCGRCVALMATYDWFRVLEGPRSQRVHDSIDLLLSPELRSSLRQWYGRPGACLEGAEVIAIRDHLSQLAGEKLEL